MPSRGARWLRPVLSLVVVLAAFAPGLQAQEEVTAILRGAVVRAGEPLQEAMVVLHRVTPGEAGEVDSVAVSADGSFELTLPRMPDPGSRSEIWFGSVRHLGVLYFGPPIVDPVQLDSIYSIEVFDTISAPPEGADVPVGVRNIFIERVEEGWQVTDLFQLHNDTDRTFVAQPGARGAGGGEGDGTPRDGSVWSYPLPPGASGFQVGQSDLPPDAVTFEGSAVRVSAPLPPGERLYLVRYLLPDLEFDLPMPGRTEIMELLILEPVPPLSVSGLRADQPVELEPGMTYRRYAGVDLVDIMVTVREAEEEGTLPFTWIAVILALVLGVAGILALAKRPGPEGATQGGTPGAEPTRAALLHEIAALDDAHAGLPDPTAQQEERYRSERAKLKERLRSLH